MTDPELLLRGPDVGQVAVALELALRTHRRNGHPPGDQLREVAAKVAQAVPLVAACLPPSWTRPGRKQPPQCEPRSAARPQARQPAVRRSWDAHKQPAPLE